MLLNNFVKRLPNDWCKGNNKIATNMKVLLICHKMPFPVHDGGAFSSYHTTLGLVSQNADVRLLAINSTRHPVNIETIPQDFVEKTSFSCVTVDTRLKPMDAFFNLFSSQSYFVGRFYSDSFRRHLIGILQNEKFDIVHLEHIYLGVYLPVIKKYSDAKLVIRPQNVENQVWQRYLQGVADPFKKTFLKIAVNRLAHFEKQVARMVDGIIAISDNDAVAFSRYAPGAAIASIPVGFDFNSIKNFDSERHYKKFPVFYHLGSMDWAPNQQGIHWFIKKVMPAVVRRCPDFVFWIAGKNMPEWCFRLANKHLMVDGAVRDALEYHQDKSVMIVPLLSGGGLRVKIIEAMALGKTVISTTIGAEGIHCTNNENILIADTAEKFAAQIQRCKNAVDWCKRIGKNARQLAIEHYDREQTAKQMINFYQKIV
jgi:polysaccharide biosynthesis protein PslH